MNVSLLISYNLQHLEEHWMELSLVREIHEFLLFSHILRENLLLQAVCVNNIHML